MKPKIRWGIRLLLWSCLTLLALPATRSYPQEGFPMEAPRVEPFEPGSGRYGENYHAPETHDGVPTLEDDTTANGHQEPNLGPAGQEEAPPKPGFFGRTEEVSEKLAPVLAYTFYKDKVEVLSLVNEGKAKKTHKEQFRGANRSAVDLDTVTREQVLQRIGAARGKMTIVVGHIEGDSVVIERQGSPNLKIKVADMEATADQVGGTLFVFGCGSAEVAGNGVQNPQIYASEVLPQIAQALQASTIGEFLSLLAGDKYGIVLNANMAEGLRRQFEVKIYELDPMTGEKMVSVSSGHFSAPGNDPDPEFLGFVNLKDPYIFVVSIYSVALLVGLSVFVGGKLLTKNRGAT